MHWLFLLIGFAIVVMSFLTTNTAVMVLCWRAAGSPEYPVSLASMRPSAQIMKLPASGCA